MNALVRRLDVGDTARKALAELLGSALLAATVVGSGIAAQRLSPDDVGLQLLQNALVTGAVLVALVLALGPVSAAFNPVVTLAERALGVLTTGQAALHVLVQVVGCCLGVVLANLMYGPDAVSVSTTERTGGGLWLGEVVATAGLVVIVLGVVRSGRASSVAFAVGGWITAAYWATSSTSFANPAITAGRVLTDTFAGIAPSSAPLFVVFQLVGGAVGLLLALVLYPDAPRAAERLTHSPGDDRALEEAP